MESSEGASPPQKGLRMRIGRVFQRSKSAGDQEGDQETPGAGGSGCSQEPGCPPVSQVGGGRRRRRSWGSWRRKKKSNEPSVLSTPLLAPPRSDISLKTNDWTLAEGVKQNSEVVNNYAHVTDTVQNTKLESQSPTSLKSPTGKSAKFRFPGLQKAEEGKKNQVLDYLEGLFGSTRRKNSKNASPASLSQSNSLEEAPPARSNLNHTEETTTAGGSPDSATSSIWQDHGSEGVTEAKAAVQDPAEILLGSPEVKDLLPAVGSPEKSSLSLSPKIGTADKNTIIVDVNLQSINSEKQAGPECAGEQLAPKYVSSKPEKEIEGNVSNVCGGKLVNKEDTSLSEICADASLLSDDRSVKECGIGELDTHSENISQVTRQLKNTQFVNSDRLAEGVCDCETIANCTDIPAITECVLPISETLRVEQVAEIIEIDVHPPKIQGNSNITLSEASVSLPINNINVKLNVLEKTLKNAETVQLNHSVPQGFKHDTANYNIPQKVLCDSTLKKQQNSSKNDTVTLDTKKSQVSEAGIVPHIGEGAETLHDNEQLATGNLVRGNQNGVVEPETNIDKTVYSSLNGTINLNNTTEKSTALFSESTEMDKKSPTETKRGKRKGKKRRSLKSDQQSDKGTGSADTSTFEEEPKGIDSSNPNKQSSDASANASSSPKQSIPSLVSHQPPPKSFPASEESAQDITKLAPSRKKNSKQVRCDPASDNKVKSPVKASLEKAPNTDSGFRGSENVISTSSIASQCGQKVEKPIAPDNSDTNFVIADNRAVEGSASNEDFIFSLQRANTNELGERLVALNSADQDNAIASVSQVCNQQNMESSSLAEHKDSADLGILKTLEINDLEGTSINHNTITSQLCSTVTTKIRLPATGKEDKSGNLNTINQQGACTETRTEEEETIRITLPKKQKATSHHQVDFLATKDLPLASTESKKYVGSLKIQLNNKSDKETDDSATNIGKNKSQPPKYSEASDGLHVEVRQKAGKISKEICMNDSDTKHKSTEYHGNKEMNTTSAPIEKRLLEMVPNAQTDRADESGSPGVVSSKSCANPGMNDQSFSMDRLTSGLCSQKVDAPKQGAEEHTADLIASTRDTALSVPLTGAELQSREVKVKTLLPLNVLIYETIESEIESVSPTQRINEQKTIQGKAKSEHVQPVQQSPPMVNKHDINTMPPHKVQTSSTPVPDIKDMNVVQKYTAGDIIVETTQQIPPKPQSGGINDVTSLESTQISETMVDVEKEVSAKSNGKMTSDSGAIKSEIVQNILPLLQNKDSKTQSVLPQPEQTLKKNASHEIKTDIPSNIKSNIELGSNEAKVETDLTLQQNTPLLQSNDSALKATISPEAEVNNKVSAKNLNELNTLTSDDFIPPMQKRMVGMQDGESKIKDIEVGYLATSPIASEVRIVVTESNANDTNTGSTATTGVISLPVEQHTSVLDNRNFEIREEVLTQSRETAESAGSRMSKSSSIIEQKPSSETAINNFGLPILSSTPKVQHKEMEPRRAVSSSNVEASAGNLSRAEDAQSANFIEKHSQLGAATNESSLSVQNVEESQPQEVIVQTPSIVEDMWNTKANVETNVDLTASANGFASSVEQATSKSEEERGFNFSFSEENSLDSSSDMDSFTETIRKYGNPIQLPQKRQRVPKVPSLPPFAMPPIQEDHISPKKEKKFDPSSFKFGLMKNKHKSDPPSSLFKMHQIETKSKVVKRVSAEQSLLFKSLANKSSRLSLPKQQKAENDLASESSSKRSRLEIDEVTAQNCKPLTEHVLESADLTPSLSKNNVIQEFQFDSSNSTFPETQLPSFMENYLKSNLSEIEKKPTESEQQTENGLSILDLKQNFLENNSDFTNTCTIDSTLALQGSSTIDGNQNASNIFGTDLFTPKSVLSNLPEVGIPGRKELSLNSRPGKIVIYNQRSVDGEAIEVFHDVEDATSWQLPSEISIRVVRGCWILYQKPNFEGDKIALEEGFLNLTDIWGKELAEDACDDTLTSTPNECSIGSLRRIVKKWGLPEIDLCTEPDGLGRKTTYIDDMEEVETYGIVEPTLSIEVYSGTWILFEEPFYQGNSYIVEPGQYPSPESWHAVNPFIGSLKPLKMGPLQVEKLNDNRVIVYEKPFFEGKQLELKTDVFSFVEGVEESALCHTYPFTNIGSMKVLGGFWVGYEKPGFQGHQYVLEEGEYQSWNEWGGYNEHLQSLRFIQNMSSPVMIMYREANFSEKGGNIEVVGPIPDLHDTDYGLRTESINVLSGIWVAYENTDYTGEQYVLEKGLYSSFEDWGAINSKISSIQPVFLDLEDNELSKFKVQFFTDPEFQGNAQTFDMDTAQFPDGFSPKSCKVQSGSWVAYDAENFTGNQYVLEEETYPDLIMMGCTKGDCIKSVKRVDFCFSIPGIILFAREKFQGKKIELVSEMQNLALQGYNNHIFSVKVNGGTWVAYERGNYQGRQILLQPCQIPNWHQHTGWHRIGSLRPLPQRRVYFRIRNQGTGTFMTFTGDLNEIHMVRVQALDSTGMDDQIWFYQDGFIKTKMADDCCLDVIGNFLGPSSRLGISIQDSKDVHIWNVSSDGVIQSGIRTDLVIDIKGGQHYDQNQTILSRLDEVQQTQRWDLEIL
ncbi:uncharacterized protein crybg1a isoform X2 [Hemiscyllium ocellatum]|uniref:uncharacterized protein crybg1a isoform X2 n=1 Tax=Hemiscyllium ocellatum TaxID=170820 RepID=UPI002966B5AA|nr:uncharacterized protein crybg1a isoform X2 [Hemiscyllium ocellatum]